MLSLQHNGSTIRLIFETIRARRNFSDKAEFFSKVVGQGENIAVTIMSAIIRLSHMGVGQEWDSGTSGDNVVSHAIAIVRDDLDPDFCVKM